MHAYRVFVAYSHEDKDLAARRTHPGNLLIVGDWFVAESVKPRPGVGYLQTVFTRHAPTVLDRMGQFDEEFEELLEREQIDAASLLPTAIARIKEELQH